MHKILITGATGTLGKATIAALKNSNQSFVAGVRDIEKARAQSGLTEEELVHFDFDDVNTFEKATIGVDRVFLLAPPLNLEVEALLTPFLTYLKAQQINRVVYVGALGMDKLPGLPFHTNLINKAKSMGFDYTILKPGFFSTNFKNYEFENITQRGITYVVAGDGKTGFVDPHDIGLVAATVLTTDGHSGKEYELTGPELLSYSDAAKALSTVIGKTIVYPNPTAEAYIAALKAAGAPDFIAEYMLPVYSLIKDGHVANLTDNIEKITGKKPTPLHEVLQRDFATN